MLEKACAQCAQALGVLPFGLAEDARQIIHKGQGVVPEGVQLHRAAVARGHRAAVGLGVHPGKLGVGVARVQQAVLVHKDVHARTLAVAAHNGLERGPGMLAHPVQALGIFLEVALHGKGVPEGGVRRVVGVVAVLGKAVGRKAVFQAAGHLLQYAQAEFRAVAVKSQTGQGNQGVAAPSVEPVVPGQHRRTA